MNLVILSGNLGRDPILKETTNFKAYKLCTASLCTSQKINNKDVKQWNNVIAWGKVAEKLALAKKGDQVLVQGKLQNRNYLDKDNKKVYVTEVVALSIYLGLKQDGEGHVFDLDEKLPF